MTTFFLGLVILLVLLLCFIVIGFLCRPAGIPDKLKVIPLEEISIFKDFGSTPFLIDCRRLMPNFPTEPTYENAKKWASRVDWNNHEYTPAELKKMIRFYSYRHHKAKEDIEKDPVKFMKHVMNESNLLDGHPDRNIHSHHFSRKNVKEFLGQSLANAFNVDHPRFAYFKIWYNKKRFTTLHDDAAVNTSLQIVGSKTWTLISPKYKKKCYREKKPNNFTNYFYLLEDPRNPDLEKFPKFKDVKTITVTVDPGFALYIPHRWMHAVETPGPHNLMLSFLWNC